MINLQNGSDIRGIALGKDKNLGMDEAEKIAKAFLAHISEGKDPATMKIAVGRDPRITGSELVLGLCKGLLSCGATVLNAGMASTPAMFMSTVFPETDADGAVMVTASHLPMDKNGLKFFTKEGGLDKEDITAILTDTRELPQAQGRIIDSPVMGLYAAHLRNLIIQGADKGPKPLTGLKICVDAGNGSGGFYAKDVLAPLGADISSSIYLEPDGTFPNHQPNPENKDAMKAISDQVVLTGADLGIIFDTDVDRSSAVTSDGREVARNGIVALAACIVAQDHPGCTVVTDSITSPQLTSFLEQRLGLKHFRYKRGYRNVITKGMETEGACLAAETSGHIAFKDNYFLDDGAYLATRIVIEAAKGKLPGEFIKELGEPAEAIEIRIPLKMQNFQKAGDEILKDFKENAIKKGITVVEPNYEGVRLDFGNGWCLLRKSLHEPLLPLNVESEEKGGTEKIVEIIREFLAEHQDIEI